MHWLRDPTPTHFSGLINDYTPMTINGKLVGPWVMNGTWSLDLKGRSGLADFSAAMNMELSDYAVVNGVVTRTLMIPIPKYALLILTTSP